MGASRRRDPLGNLWSSLTGYFKRQLEGSGKAASLSVGALLGGLLSGDPDRYGEEGSGDRHHPMGVQSPGTLSDSCKGALETGHLSLSLWELCKGNLEGGLLC